MKRLEDIPKKTLFEVPEGYFDRLPGVIQARISAKNKQSIWVPSLGYSLKFALPAIALAALAFLFWSGPSRQTTEEVLASIDSEQLVAYLQDSDLNADDFLEAVPLDQEELASIQQDVINEMNFEDVNLQELVNEFDVDYNKLEYEN